MKIQITVDGTIITGTLADSAAGREFAALLPLTLALADYAGTEKIADLPKRLDTSGAPPGHEPRPGDIAYFAPWGNLALFHKGFHHSEGLVKLGTMDTDIEILRRRTPQRARIELIAAPAR